MKKQIFISSTYIDLIPHRKNIWKLLQSFNVSISGMEKFGARTEKPLETCLKEVQESDIYIGIIAMRYGSIEQSSKKSFSQLEYEKAQELGKEILIFIIDENTSKVNTNHIDFEHYENLRKFKNLLKVNHTVESFSDSNDLITNINLSLRKVLSSESIKKYYRPKKIEGTLEKFKIREENWILILGKNFGKPFEIFISRIDDSFVIPSWLKTGWIIKSSSRNDFDFQFIDNEGYKITFEGISRFTTDIITNLTSKLLEKDISVEKIIEILYETKFDKGEFEIGLKKAIKKALISSSKKMSISD